MEVVHPRGILAPLLPRRGRWGGAGAAKPGRGPELDDDVHAAVCRMEAGGMGWMVIGSLDSLVRYRKLIILHLRKLIILP